MKCPSTSSPLLLPLLLLLVSSFRLVDGEFMNTAATGNRYTFDYTRYIGTDESEVLNEVALEHTAGLLLVVMEKNGLRTKPGGVAPAVNITDSVTLEEIVIEEGNYRSLNSTIRLTGDAIVKFRLLDNSERHFELVLDVSSPPPLCSTKWIATATGGPSCPCDNTLNCVHIRSGFNKRTCASYTCLFPVQSPTMVVSHIDDDSISDSNISVLVVNAVVLVCLCAFSVGKKKKKARTDAVQGIIGNLPEVDPPPETICSICLESAEETAAQQERAVWVSLTCSHTFHRSCIITWLLRADPPSCPSCRELVLAFAPPTENSPDSG